MADQARSFSVREDAEIIELDRRVKRVFHGSSWKGRKKTHEWNVAEEKKHIRKEKETAKENGKVSEKMHRERYEKAIAWAKENSPGIMESVKREFMKERPDERKLWGKKGLVR